MSKLALTLIREAKENQSTFLDLGNCGLTELPAELFELVDLEVLCLCTIVGYYDENQKLVDFISKNKGTSNYIHRFPPEINQLAKLKMLLANGNSMENWQLSDLSPLKDLDNLQVLEVSNTQVSDLSPLKDLDNLQILEVSDTQVSDLSPLKGLVNLKRLFVATTQVSDLGPLHGLRNLQALNLYNTQVRDLSPLQGLSNLQELYAHFSQINDLSPLQEFLNLQTLTVVMTQVRDLSPLQKLGNLKRFVVSRTQASDLSPLKTIIEKGIPVIWEETGRRNGIYVKDCPLVNPPIAIAEQGNEAILRYWKEQARSGTRKVNEARLLVVGQGGAGKTTLKDKLKNVQAPLPEPDATTRGINIEPIRCKNREGDDFTVNIWDFGGQNIQHYAHQFFMSDSVVYAVLSNTREQNANFQYWLNIIELLGKSSPFFIVQNEKDGHTEGLKEIVKIQERFPQTFQSVEQVNLKNAASDRRFVALKEKLFHSATQLPHTQKEVINSFFNAREKLAALSETEPTIPFATFRQYCRDEGIEDKNLMNDYALMMTELGIALYYPDDLHLKNTVFLSPKWLIDALFKLLYHPSVEAQHGQFTSAAADAIWSAPEYEDKHGLLIQVMEKFRLCYKTRSDTYIVPQRLPLRKEAFVPAADATHLIYQYKFLPSGFLTQLTCEMHDKIEAEKVWSDAVQFVSKDGQGRVFARENNQDHKIELFGFGASKSDLLNRAVEVIDDIHTNTKFKNLVVDKLVPCPCAACKKDDKPHFFKYEVLKRRLQNGKTKTECEKSDEELYIAMILKNANIQAVTMTEIRGLIAQYKPQEAVNLLKGLYPNEWAQMSGRLSHLSHTDRSGIIAHGEKSLEYNKWAQDFLGIAADLLR